MSNFIANTRLKGSADKYKKAIWLDNYFGPRQYGVCFCGTHKFLKGEDYEIERKPVKEDE